MSGNNTPEENKENGFATEVTMVGGAGAPAADPGVTEVTMVDGGQPRAGTEVPMPTDEEEIEKTRQLTHTPGSTHLGDHLQPGDRLDRYVIVRKLGQGGMGSVYLVRHETLGVFRAAKVLSGALYARGGEFVNRFIQEAKIACAISHPNIVNVLDVGEDSSSGMCYIIMEYVDGGTVRDVLRTIKRFSEPHAVIITAAVAEALQAAASQKIVHRDIKPDNIMLTRRGEIKLADLGIAKNNEEDVQLTRSHVMMGTPAYLAPEQARDAHSVDVRADIYSLGATLYEMLTGEIPYPGKSTYDILAKLMSSPVPDPRARAANVSPQTAKLVMKMLAKEARQRPATPMELLKDIRSLNILPPDADPQQSVRELLEQSGTGKYSVMSGTAVTSRPLSAWRLRRKPLLAAIGAAAILLIGVSLALWSALRAKPSAPPSATVVQVKPDAPAATPEKPAPVTTAVADVTPEAPTDGDIRTKGIPSAAAAVKTETPPSPAAEVRTGTPKADGPVRIETPKADGDIKPVAPAPPSADAGSAKPVKSAAPAPKVREKIAVSAEVAPIGAHAVLRNDRGVAVAERTVPASGRIRFEIPEGQYTLQITAAGHRSVTRAFPVSGSRTITGMKIVLTQDVSRCAATVYGAPKLLEHVRKNGLEIRVDNGMWSRVEKFPHVMELSRQTHTVELRGAGIRPVSQTVQIAPDQTRCAIEFFLAAQEAHLEISTSIPDPVQINLTGIWEPLNSIVRLPPFRSYTLKWRIGGEEQDAIAIPELLPGVVRRIKLERRRPLVLPGAAEFAEAEKLAQNGDYREAAEKYAAASEKGHPEADYQLGKFAEDGKGRWFASDTDALELYRKAAAAPRNDPRAQYRVGLFCEEGRGGLDRDLQKALQWYARAAERKNPDAMFRMGMAYKAGEGDLPVDFQKMISLLTAAALAGHAEAQYELGFCYENGLGVPINVSLAKSWYAKSSAQGSEKAARRGKALEDIK